MGDYYWFGCEGRRDVTKSVELYGLAASKGDPQVENQHGSQRSKKKTTPSNQNKDNIRKNLIYYDCLYSFRIVVIQFKIPHFEFNSNEIY